MKKSHFKILVFIIVFLLLVSMLLVAYFLYFSKAKNKTSENIAVKNISNENIINTNTLESNIEDNNLPYESQNDNKNETVQYKIDKTKKYLALGDSITLGTGLESKEKDSYSSLLSNNFTLILNDAIDGMSCSWLSHKFDQGDYEEELKKADIITISVGSNDLLGVFYKILADSFDINLKDTSNILESASKKFSSSTLQEKYNMLNNLYTKMNEDETKNQISKAMDNYKKCWPKIIKHIKSLNHNSQIIAIEYYNPYHNIKIPFIRDILFNDYFDSYVEELNNFLYEHKNLGYDIANIKDDFYSSFSTNVNISPLDFSLDPHPNKLGHRIIYEKIMQILNSK